MEAGDPAASRCFPSPRCSSTARTRLRSGDCSGAPDRLGGRGSLELTWFRGHIDALFGKGGVHDAERASPIFTEKMPDDSLKTWSKPLDFDVQGLEVIGNVWIRTPGAA